jgi:Ca-activated chloride channel family protein
MGHYIPNLQQSDFALLDDQKAPAKVNSFHQQINLPLRVGLVIDSSTSIRSRFQFEQQSATEFLLQILKAKSDRAFVMDFAETPRVDQDWTNNHRRVGDGRQPDAPRAAARRSLMPSTAPAATS